MSHAFSEKRIKKQFELHSGQQKLSENKVLFYYNSFGEDENICSIPALFNPQRNTLIKLNRQILQI